MFDNNVDDRIWLESDCLPNIRSRGVEYHAQG